MDYLMALRPHENARYQQAQCGLSTRELSCLLEKCGHPQVVELKELGGAPFLSFTLDEQDEQALAFVCRHSCLYFVAQVEQGLLRPVSVQKNPFVPAHMPHVQKYKGKTNATFTALLLNLALCACQTEPAETLTLLDPMCGRGTTLYTALVNGMNAFGVEQDAAAVKDASQFAETFCRYERIPLRITHAARTLEKGKSAPETTLLVGDKASPRSLILVKADTQSTVPAVKCQCAHLLVTDLPYGVQHAPGQNGKMSTFINVLKDALPVWRQALKPGAGVAISFNTYTLKREMLHELLDSAGFTVLEAPFTGFEHWVEQAVSRDIIVARATY